MSAVAGDFDPVEAVDLACPGAGQKQDRVIVRQAANPDRAIFWKMRRKPFEIMAFRRRRRPVPDPSAGQVRTGPDRIGKVRDGRFGLHIAMPVQHIAEPDTSDAPRHPPAEQAVQPVMDSVAGDFYPVEAVDLGQADR